MSDEIDIAQEREQADTALAINAVRKRAAAIEPGEAGECEYCGEWSARIVRGACAPCRDQRKLP